MRIQRCRAARGYPPVVVGAKGRGVQLVPSLQPLHQARSPRLLSQGVLQARLVQEDQGLGLGLIPLHQVQALGQLAEAEAPLGKVLPVQRDVGAVHDDAVRPVLGQPLLEEGEVPGVLLALTRQVGDAGRKGGPLRGLQVAGLRRTRVWTGLAQEHWFAWSI